MRPDGTVVEVLEDGTERPFPERPPMRPMTDEEVEAAALSDPDCPPLTEEELARLKPVSRVKRLRWALHLSREEFASRYGIPLDTIRDWERGQSEPDQTSSAYLHVIAADPEMVERLLQAEPQGV